MGHHMQENNEADFDIEKVNALPVYRPEDYLRSVDGVAAFAREYLAHDVSDEERRSALEIIASTKNDTREPSTEQLLILIGSNTNKRINLSLEDLDIHLKLMREAIKLSRDL